MSISRGPWRLDVVTKEAYGCKSVTRHVRDSKDNSLMCDETYYPWCPDGDDDWRLISSAPELLEALKAVIDWVEGSTEYADVELSQRCKKARAAIAKAEGR